MRGIDQERTFNAVEFKDLPLDSRFRIAGEEGWEYIKFSDDRATSIPAGFNDKASFLAIGTARINPYTNCVLIGGGVSQADQVGPGEIKAGDLTLTQRELDEIELAMYYDARLQHGTAGHNRLLLIAKLARAMKDIEDNLGQVVMDGLAGAMNRVGNADAGLHQDASGVTTLDGEPIVPSTTEDEDLTYNLGAIKDGKLTPRDGWADPIESWVARENRAKPSEAEHANRVGRFYLHSWTITKNPVYVSFVLRSVNVLSAAPAGADGDSIMYVASGNQFDEIEYNDCTCHSDIPLYSVIDESESSAGPRWKPQWGEMAVKFVRRSGDSFDEDVAAEERTRNESELGESIDSRLGDEPIPPSDRVAEIALANPLVHRAFAAYREGGVTYTEALEAALVALHGFVDTPGGTVSRDSSGHLILTVPGKGLRQDENGVTTLDGDPIENWVARENRVQPSEADDSAEFILSFGRHGAIEHHHHDSLAEAIEDAERMLRTESAWPVRIKKVLTLWEESGAEDARRSLKEFAESHGVEFDE